MTCIYHDFSHEEYERDRMLRKACGSFALMVAGELPGDLEVAKSFSLAGVFDWYQDCPQQIARVVLA